MSPCQAADECFVLLFLFLPSDNVQRMAIAKKDEETENEKA